MVSPRLKLILNWAGFGFGLLGVFFVVFKLVEYGEQIDFFRFGFHSIFALSALALLYGVLNLFLAFAWRDLLKHFGVLTRTNWAIRTFGVSQLAKYVPGNIFHLAGRQAIGLAAGLASWPLAKSMIWEIGVISLTGSLFILLALPLYYSFVPVFVAITVFFIAIMAGSWAAWRWFDNFIKSAAGWYFVFLLLSGIIFCGVVILVVPLNSFTFSAITGIVGAYVVAWLGGLITPGAPAGVGVRELILFFFLQAVVSEADIVTAIVLGRMVTVGGDVFFYFVALYYPNSKNAIETASHGKNN